MPGRTSKRLQYASCGGLLLAAVMLGATPAWLNYSIDPYEMFRSGQLSKAQRETAEKKHYPLWKFAHYKRDAQIVILGDSRARALRDKYWYEYGAAPAFNFAYGGGTIPEIHSTFQAIKNDPKLKTLVVGIQLRSLDETHKGGLNRVPEARKATASPVAYLKNWFVAKQSWRVLKERNPWLAKTMETLTPSLVNDVLASSLGEPGQADADTLLLPDVVSANASNLPARELPPKFERQVTRNARSDWKGFQFSSRYMGMVEEMAQWADARPDRRLIFVIPPTVIEMQHTIDAYGLTRMNDLFRRELTALAPVIDLDFDSAITRDLGNFTDAYHFNSKVARRIVGEIMTVLGTNEQQAKRIERRRKTLRCPSPERTLTPAADSFVEGQSCRVWTEVTHG
ncbi:MAG: hypothetical protein OXR62_09415 [Ahrensia sp.]|nr:hypothetical protein [Ahrensia sp.]